MPLIARVVRDKLAVELVDSLGTYQLPNGSTAAAIYVVTNVDKDPPRDWQVSGIECLVSSMVDRVPQACFGGIADKYQWVVNLIQHDKDRNLNNAIEVFFCHYQRVRLAWHRSQSEEDFEQCQLYLPGQQYFEVIS